MYDDIAKANLPGRLRLDVCFAGMLDGWLADCFGFNGPL